MNSTLKLDIKPSSPWKPGTCRVSGEKLSLLLDLGNLYVSDFLPAPDPLAARSPLTLGWSPASRLVQLTHTFDQPQLYRHYWYRSGTNELMRRELRDLVETACRWALPRPGEAVLDIGANDGTLLSCYPEGLFRVAVDPALNLAEECRPHCEVHLADFFSAEAVRGAAGSRQYQIVTSIAMFYDLPDPVGFAREVASLLAKEGVWVLQLSYTPLMVIQNAFDNIGHEHLEYYTLASLIPILQAAELTVAAAEVNPTNGGSLRLVIRHQNQELRAPGYLQDVGRVQFSALKTWERREGYDEPVVFHRFTERIHDLRDRTRETLMNLRGEGKTVLGYGASTKGNTLLQWYGIGPDWIPAIADRQPGKKGLVTAGSWIPIISEAEMRAWRPDVLFVLPWHFLNGFLQREAEFLDRGGQFLVPLPELQLVGREGSRCLAR